MGSALSCECYKQNKGKCYNCQNKYCTKCLKDKKTGKQHMCLSRCCSVTINPFDYHFCKCMYCKIENKIQTEPNKSSYKCRVCCEKYDTIKCNYCLNSFYEFPHMCKCGKCNSTVSRDAPIRHQSICINCNNKDIEWTTCTGCRLKVFTKHNCKCVYCSNIFINNNVFANKCGICKLCSNCNRYHLNVNKLDLCLECQKINYSNHNIDSFGNLLKTVSLTGSSIHY